VRSRQRHYFFHSEGMGSSYQVLDLD
jgi:hypothetical protein